ncbi:hypothetical protein D3C71_2036080 [compost metagenome]
MHRFADPKRNRHQVDNQRPPQSEGDRHRQAVFDELNYRGAAEQAVAEIEADVVPEHFEIALVNGFVETVAVGDLSDHLRI